MCPWAEEFHAVHDCLPDSYLNVWSAELTRLNSGPFPDQTRFSIPRTWWVVKDDMWGRVL
eukprot:m.139586 g.139586  ORF g.139586 m.139586 type:complete len:60 (+) comp14019_c0_seq4:3523-3702(+)